MLEAPSGAGTRVSALLRGGKKQLLGSIVIRQGCRSGFGSGIILKSWKICTGGMGSQEGGLGVESREWGEQLPYPPLPTPHSPLPIPPPLPICPSSRANGLLFCQPVRPERRKFSSRRMVISQKIGSMSIARHLRPVISAARSVVPECEKKSSAMSPGEELASMIRVIALSGFCA